MRKQALALATASAIALGGVAAPANVANAAPISTNFISPNNGDVLRGTGISKNQLPGPLRNLYERGYLDEAMVGTGIALGLIVATIYAAQSFHNLQIGDGWAKPGNFRLPF